MITSNKIQKALQFAYKVHQVDQKQSRKGKQIPYIFHPLAVANILDKVNATEDQIVAGILHDTIEDSIQGYKVTKEDLEKEFGQAVARMVNDLSEQDKSLPWDVRKQQALEHIPSMEHNSLLVKSADVLHNLTDQIEDYQFKGDKMFENYNAPKAAQLASYQKLVNALRKAWPQNPLLNNLEKQIKIAKRLWSK